MLKRGRRAPRTCVGRTRWILLVCTVFAVLLMAITAAADSTQEGEETTSWLSVGGLAFFDLYHVVSHHTTEGDGATGAVLRRGYLTFDGDFSETLFGRLRFEVNQSGAFETYDFEADVKDLYLGWNVGRHRLLVGLVPTPTFSLFESIWGLRYLVRTPLDLQGEPSRDTGVFAEGPLNAAATVRYRAMLGSGAEFGAESGDGRKWMAAVTWQPRPRWTLDFYADYERLEGATDRRTLQAFVAYQTDELRWSALYCHQDRQDDPPLELASAFVVGRLTKRSNIVGRIDRLMEPSPKGDNIAYIPFDPTATATFFYGGVEFLINQHFRITPNTYVTVYDCNDEGVRPDTDLAIRLTFSLDFE